MHDLLVSDSTNSRITRSLAGESDNGDETIGSRHQEEEIWRGTSTASGREVECSFARSH